MHRSAFSCAITVLACLSLAGCQRLAAAELPDAEAGRALRTYADIALATYSDAAHRARDLIKAVDAFLAEPSEDQLAKARAAWLAARVPYACSEVFRFYDGPIDAVELLVNTWPIDESYVEDPAARSGIIDDAARYPQITRELLIEENGKAGETSIATGYHVIEFLLWGQDLSRDGPGARPFTDFQLSGVGAGDRSLVERRRRYLKVAAELLVEHLDGVVEAWRERPGSYRQAFLRRPPREALALALKGMGSLSGAELAGERLTVAYETKHQENEHSCFSDSTHLDLAGNARGLQNVCTGRYGEVSGPGLCALIGAKSPRLAAVLQDQIAASVRAIEAIPAPFDTAILGGDASPPRKAVAAAIAALQQQTQTLAEIAEALSLAAPSAGARR